MKLTVEALDAKSIDILPLPELFMEYCKKKNWLTIGQLRHAYQDLESRPPKGVGYGKGLRRLLLIRFSLAPTCTKCGSLMLLHESFRSCPEGCGGLIPMEGKAEVRKAFPDLAVNRKKTEKATPKGKILPGQKSMFDREEYKIASDEYLD